MKSLIAWAVVASSAALAIQVLLQKQQILFKDFLPQKPRTFTEGSHLKIKEEISSFSSETRIG
jgi:hypothetical protein